MRASAFFVRARGGRDLREFVVRQVTHGLGFFMRIVRSRGLFGVVVAGWGEKQQPEQGEGQGVFRHARYDRERQGMRQAHFSGERESSPDLYSLVCLSGV